MQLYLNNDSVGFNFTRPCFGRSHNRYGMIIMMKENRLLILLLALMKTRIYASEKNDFHKYDHAKAEANYDSKNTMHNVTMDCGDEIVLFRTVAQCQRELWQLGENGDAWFPRDMQTRVGDNLTAKTSTDDLRDSIDHLDHTCYMQERSRKCLEENGVQDYCLNIVHKLGLGNDLQFICQHQPRDENLIHALQCLRDKRVIVMLLFHIANHCYRGMDILDDLMTRTKNEYFYKLAVNHIESPSLTPVYCLPRDVISTCVAEIVEDHCGKRSSELVQNYLLYFQDRYGQSLKSAGLSSNICQYQIGVNSTLMMPPTDASERHGKLGFVRGLEMAAPGTALDTFVGRSLLAFLHKLPGREVCSTESTAYFAYTACVMSSDDKHERSKFNILQFGQGLFPFIYHGTQCLRLEQFTACWNLLREMCGPAVRGFAQHATLLVEGCKIKSEMDTAGCHWQDMLVRRYLQASRVTVWPLVTQGLSNPLLLESSHDQTRVMEDLDTVISLLRPGVEEISRKCGKQLAKRLQAVLQQVRYQQYDAVKVAYLIVGKLQHLYY